MAIYRFTKRRYTTNDLWDTAYRNGICVGEIRSDYHETHFYLKDENLYTRCSADTLEELAKEIEKLDFFRRSYDFWKGAYHYYFDVSTGYTHISNYHECFDVVKEVIVVI